MSQTAYKQGMLAWDGPTNYVIYIYICLPVENKVMPSFGITIIETFRMNKENIKEIILN